MLLKIICKKLFNHKGKKEEEALNDFTTKTSSSGLPLKHKGGSYAGRQIS